MHSMIGYWHHDVVRPSVCNAVHCGFQGRCTGQKLYQRVPSRQVLICPFKTLLLQYVSFSHKTHRKKPIEENVNVIFWDTHNHACTGRVTFCYSLTSWTTELLSATLNGHTWQKFYLVPRSRSSWPKSNPFAILCVFTVINLHALVLPMKVRSDNWLTESDVACSCNWWLIMGDDERTFHDSPYLSPYTASRSLCTVTFTGTPVKFKVYSSKTRHKIITQDTEAQAT